MDITKRIFTKFCNNVYSFIVVGISDLAKSLTLDFIGVTLKLFQVLGTVTTSVNKIVTHVHLSKLTEL